MAEAKATSGKFHLSGLNTEHVLGSFAVSPRKMGTLKVEFKSKDPYDQNKELYVSLLRDDKWDEYQKAPSCTEKFPFSLMNEKVTMNREKKHYKGEISMELNNHKDDKAHYYYFVITDCSLEFYMHDDAIPKMTYTLTTWNDGSHVSADEVHLENLHTITLLLSGVLAITLCVVIVIQLYEKSTVHAAVFLVMAAAASDSFSSMFELFHLSLYAHNGIGSYAMDAISAHLEAVCDSLVALLLLSVAAGWTLPSDVVAVQHNATPLQKVLGGLQSPFEALRDLKPTAFLGSAIFISHIVLAQWGRMYNDDFDSYHDLNHLPGKFLMLNRIILGVCMMACSLSTRMRCPPSLRSFYMKLTLIGTTWFLSLPLLTLIVNTLVPYYMRHRAVGVWGAVLQTSGIVLLSWLVTSHSTSYHKLSHLSSTKENLTDSLSRRSDGKEGSQIWAFGKTKVRLD
eukprot:CAMPEP_0201128934 /NCGR_PEP_ID=MMETSP0850-20130426/35278_1 /ASSEMBLY_ACC=CAM_ASM_000622 /TAXON_ID=183588 /ORGANISM="Pseudo-nitzschia fraudulenta, Strain WWA7" /LENGTH=453 /DNA_ID=CAMNT_0047398273 /DNA_START=81 /DNA_END=1442 /DNA_ORIENTATION=-